jgi:molecular chaperone DnaJ
MSKQNYYQILGVATNVSTTELKRAYRLLVKDLHPDIDHHKRSDDEKSLANTKMQHINEAYSTLVDKTRRSEYDIAIGLHRQTIKIKLTYESEDEARNTYMRKTFLPQRKIIAKTLNLYKSELQKLSQDLYDEELLDDFENYVDKLESTLRQASMAFSQQACPRSLEAAVSMMRYSIAQASDGLDELKYFLGNFDYDHLSLAQNLFRISSDLSRRAQELTRVTLANY